jgi:hypothetical protein
MARTTRNTQGGHSFHGYWQTLLRIYDRRRQSRDRYAQMQIQQGREVPWLAALASKTDQELMAESIQEYQRASRDGRDGLSCTTQNSGFKRQCKLVTRRANKRYCDAVAKDLEYWNEHSAPKSHDTARYIWDWW